MKIAISGPHYWPYRRRGSAAYIYNLSRHLARLGHAVTVVTAKPGRTRTVRRDDGVTIRYLRSLQHSLFFRWNIDRVHLFTVNCLDHFLRNEYDLVYCMYHPDGYALHLLRTLRLKGVRHVQLVPTTPFELHWRHSPIDPYMFFKAVRSADASVAPSAYAGAIMRRDHGLECTHVPCGVDMWHFRPLGGKDLRAPRILCTAALHDARKNVPLLVKAFGLLRESGVPAILQLAAETTPETDRALQGLVSPEAWKAVEILPMVTHLDLPRYYSGASMTVLASVNETFGMALIESLACGTPVVGTRSGAIPEIIDNPAIGALFDREADEAASAENLCRAMRETLDLAADETTAARCVEHAAPYDWQAVARQMASLYERVLAVGQ